MTDSQSAADLALLVGTPERRRLVLPAIEAEGLSAIEVDDPYLAMAELCRMPVGGLGDTSGVSVLILSLHGIYREELQMIPAVRRRFPAIEIWVTDLEGRSAALAEAMRLGIEGLLGEDGLHRLSDRAKSQRGATRSDDQGSGVSSISTPVVPHETAPPNGRPGRREPVPATEPPKRKDRDPRRVAEPRSQEPVPAEATSGQVEDPFGLSPGEPILTAEELRALLHDQPDVTH